LLKHYRETAVMGFIPVLLNLKTVLKNLSNCKKAIEEYRPDVVILVDYPGFNLKIAQYVKETLRIPVYYYISPKIWAWKEYRIKNIKRDVDLMLSILPFETAFYEKHDFPVEYVGNPSVDACEKAISNGEPFKDFTQRNRLSDKPVIALLAGSRKAEVRKNLPAMLNATTHLTDYQRVIAGAPGLTPDDYAPFIANSEVSVIFGQTYPLLLQAKAALVTSGTATLETALLRVPQAVCYKIIPPHFASFIFKHFFKVRYISLVNLVADAPVVKELFGAKFRVKNIREEIDRILFDTEYRDTMLQGYACVRERLDPPGASQKAATTIYKNLRR
jgi:lipid-A-disaccharide synthase